MTPKASIAIFLALLAALPVATAGAAAPQFQGASANGGAVFFTTAEQLVPGDTDNRIDVYKRSFEADVVVGGSYVTRQISTGPTGGNDAVDALFQGASETGSRVFFQTAEPLVAADTDRSTDVYAREASAGAPELVTVGAAGQNGAANASFSRSTPDGQKVFFVTSQAFSSLDQDGSVDDVYERDLVSDQTHLVTLADPSCAGCEPGALPAFSGVAPDGERAFFASSGKFTAGDTDTAIDIYARDLPDGPTELISAGAGECLPVCGNVSSQDAVFGGSSDDGTKVFFETAEAMVGADVDVENDVYERSVTTTLISPGTEDEPANVSRQPTTFEPAISDDGSDVFFETTEPLLTDADQANDVYGYIDGSVRLVTPNGCTGSGCDATYAAITPDGAKLAFSSAEQLDPADDDGSPDLYLTSTAGGSATLVSAGASSCAPSCGNQDGFPVVFNWMKADGSAVLFGSREKLSSLDGDTGFDIFLRDLNGSETEFVSPPGLCPLPAGCDAGFTGTSVDGSRVFFQTADRLDPDDTDLEVDLYERDRGEAATRLISRKNEATIGPGTPILTGTNPVSPGASTTPAVLGHSDPGTTLKLYFGAGCQGLPVQTQSPATAAQLEGTGIVISVEAGKTTTVSASATDAQGVDSGCSAPLSYKQEDPPPPGEEGDGDDPVDPPPTGGGTSGGTSGAGSSGGDRKGRPGIVYVAPNLRITFGPAAKTRSRRPVFRFFDTTGQPGSSFSCKLDRQRWKRCDSPIKLPRLSFGSHVFSVNAVNAMGERAPSPVRRKFKVVR